VSPHFKLRKERWTYWKERARARRRRDRTDPLQSPTKVVSRVKGSARSNRISTYDDERVRCGTVDLPLDRDVEVDRRFIQRARERWLSCERLEDVGEETERWVLNCSSGVEGNGDRGRGQRACRCCTRAAAA
jgi:hypothetical protein